MRILIDFKCDNGHIHERFIDASTQEVRCETCGEVAYRVISPVRSLMDPFSGHFHDATRKWEKYHEDMAKKGSEE